MNVDVLVTGMSLERTGESGSNPIYEISGVGILARAGTEPE